MPGHDTAVQMVNGFLMLFVLIYLRQNQRQAQYNNLHLIQPMLSVAIQQ